MHNYDARTVEGFGDEWSRFDQSSLDEQELRELFQGYFKIFPWDALPQDAVGFDLGCGSGRWATLVAPRVRKLYCIDASSAALEVAKRNLQGFNNCEFLRASVDNLPLPDDSMDFGYSLGVLQHIPDTAGGLKACVHKLKQHAPFLLYLYYFFENRPPWYRLLWQATDFVRRMVSRLPSPLKYLVSQVLALCIYYPLSRTALLVERMGFRVDLFPLSSYRTRSFYVMRTDALDRFGTRLEKRFSSMEVREMMEDAGLERIEISDSLPYWCAVGYKKSRDLGIQRAAVVAMRDDQLVRKGEA